MSEYRTRSIIAGMGAWFKNMRATSGLAARTPKQEGWDSAILTASEFIRRYDNYDEERAAALLELLSDRLPED